MLYNLHPVPTVSCHQAVDNFIQFLNGFTGGVVLAAHNCFRFDAPLLLRLVSEVGMLNQFSKVVKGFIDTLIVLKKCLIDRTAAKESFKLTALAEKFINADFTKEMHNALIDAKVLESLIHHPLIDIAANDLLKSAVTVNNICMREQRSIECKLKKSSLNVLLAEKDEHGKSSKVEGASARVAILLGQSVDGKARVTTSKKIVDAIVKRLVILTAQ
ncbi:uncharacterized protein [Venturia canescens]|uniref:uncharacterized protein n=1 Tax=Venturia canescens TaxID=32260 RepID=UPI001C9C5AAD|nr:uncharacterized protein LOC122410420 [Venturia canescens]